MLDTVVMSGDDVCCSVVFGTLVGVFVLSVMWSELLMTSAISCPLWSSWSVCGVVVVPYVVRAVVAVTVMHVLLFVLHVCVLWECEGARVTAVLVWGPGEVWLR